MTYKQFPHLTRQEFAEACHLLDSRYCRATLGPLRREWRLNVHSALGVPPAHGGVTTFLQIMQPLPKNGVDDVLASQMGAFGLGDEMTEADPMMVERENADKVSKAIYMHGFNADTRDLYLP